MSTTRERMPGKGTLIWISLLIVGAALVLRAYSFTSAGLDWDESLYIVIAQRWLEGGIPYVAVWDQHPMGLPAIFTGMIALIGDGLLAVRIAAFIVVVGVAILLVQFLRRFAQATVAGVLAASFYLFYMTRPEGLAANTELFNNFVVALASFLLFAELSDGPRPMRMSRIFLAGLLFGIGLQIKYVVLPEAAILCGSLMIWNWHETKDVGRTARMAIVAIIGGLLPTILMTLYFWREGALQPYLDANIRANLTYLDDGTSPSQTLLLLRFGLLPLIGLLPWPFVLAFLFRDGAVRAKHGKFALWLVLWVVAASIDVAMPLKLWKHYFNALIPPLCLMAGLAILLVVQNMRAYRIWATAALAVIVSLPALGSMIRHAPDSRTIDRQNVPRAIADQIRQSGTNGHDVYVFNYDALVYADADVAPPTRYVLGIDLAEFNMFSNVRSKVEIGRILAGRPQWIVVADPSPYIYPKAVWNEVITALRGYQVVDTYHEADYIQPPIEVRLYRRKDETASAN